jgi:hypothetical protein
MEIALVIVVTAVITGWLSYNLYTIIIKPATLTTSEVNTTPVEPVITSEVEIKADAVVEVEAKAEVVTTKAKRVVKPKSDTTKTKAPSTRTKKIKTEEVVPEVAVKVKVPKKPNIKIAK